MSRKNHFEHIGTYTKNDIVDDLFNSIGFSKKSASEMVEFCFDTIKKKLASDANVKISSFGHFVILDKNEKMGRDLTTGKKIQIPARRVVTFKASLFLKEKIQKNLT